MLNHRRAFALSLLGLACWANLTPVAYAQLATVAVQTSGTGTGERASYDGVVEAVRQTSLSAQVPGAIVALSVRAGDTVRAGQDIARIDASAAVQNASASSAQVEAAKASLNVATKELERQKQLFQKQYISQSALDRAQAQAQAAQAQVNALQAQTDAAQTQTRYFAIKAPYSGVVSEVLVALGDMAMPGRPLVTLYDPSALRITAAVPQSALADAGAVSKIQFEIPDLPGAQSPQAGISAQVLPLVDAATHTAQVRVGLPASLKSAAPGMFARVWLAANTTAGATGLGERFYIPANTVVRRAEMTGVYVVDDKGRALLRQVRLGPQQGERIEVLSGVQKTDKLAADPQAAAKAK